MKILFITHFYYPHIGGVEKHVSEISKSLITKGHSVTIFTENYTGKLKNNETIDGVRVVRFFYPHIKFLGLLSIWVAIWKNRKLISESDVVHVHDVFIWYLPFRMLHPFKRIMTTFHGWEGVWPLPIRNIFLKRLASTLSNKTIVVGKYIDKYYGIRSDKVIYGGQKKISSPIGFVKIKDSYVFVGRLEPDTGVPAFLNYLNTRKEKLKVKFVGEGGLRDMCKKYGVVYGNRDPVPFLKKSEYCIPGGYLSYIEGKYFGCKIKTYSTNTLKVDYWKEIQKINMFPTWDKLADEYLDLYKLSNKQYK